MPRSGSNMTLLLESIDVAPKDLAIKVVGGDIPKLVT